jgi:hypothetical protein
LSWKEASRDGLIQTLVKVPESIVGPERPLQFLARDYLSRGSEQKGKYFERLILQRYLLAALAQFPRRKVHLE